MSHQCQAIPNNAKPYAMVCHEASGHTMHTTSQNTPHPTTCLHDRAMTQHTVAFRPCLRPLLEHLHQFSLKIRLASHRIHHMLLDVCIVGSLDVIVMSVRHVRKGRVVIVSFRCPTLCPCNTARDQEAQHTFSSFSRSDGLPWPTHRSMSGRQAAAAIKPSSALRPRL